MFTSVARRVATPSTLASARRGISVQASSRRRQWNQALDVYGSRWQSLLHGSPEAKQAGDLDIQQHSRLVGRGKYIHDFEMHRAKPDKIDEYKKAAERYYKGIQEDPQLHVKLTGNWETLVGDQDTFVHILEYENYGGYDKTIQLLRTSEVRCSHIMFSFRSSLITFLRQHHDAYKAMLPFLTSRTNQLNQEFAILPTAPPRAEGGIFELRTYQLKPGTLLEWENTWRRGIEARRKSVAPVGAWFSQVGRLHQVHHMWQYPNLQTRKDIREKAWQIDGWAETVSKVSNLLCPGE
ncbi:NIPSNAP-domain-containing protein [Flammula alnicola]|nr:NIPSNAP-domain-containing protein [Flammula alnicola]